MASQVLINIGTFIMQSQHNQVDESTKKNNNSREKILESNESSRSLI